LNQTFGPASSQTSNNMAADYYSESIYLLAQILAYVCILYSVVALLLMIAGLFGAKLIALEAVRVVQLTCLALTALTDLSPTY